jgi:transcriptional regulator with XRE-family HTH domain
LADRKQALQFSDGPSRKKPAAGAHLAALRKAAGLSQAAPAEAIGVPQSNIGFWEFADKPPRSDVLPALSRVLGVSVESLLSPGAESSLKSKHRGPKGKLIKAFEIASSLPKKQQELVEKFVDTLAAQLKAG